MSDNLKGKMVDALTWTSIDRFGQQGVQFVIGLIYARLLAPEEFGLIGLVMFFVAIAYVFIESGFTQALIRKKNADNIDYSTVFFFNFGISTFLYLLFFFISPFIANLFNQPHFVEVGRVAFFVIVFNSLCLIPSTILSKELNFKTIAIVNIIALIISGTAGVVLAFNNMGIWALVAQQVLFVFVRWVNFNLFFKWKPLLVFKLSVIKEFAPFSVHLLGTAFLNVIFNNIFLIIMGMFYSIKQVGFYTQGNKLSETFNYSIQSVLSASTYPLFAKIHDDNERLLRIFREITRKIAFVVLPVLMSLVFVAKPLIHVLLTQKFSASVPYFQLLLLASLFTPFYLMNINLLNSRGKSKLTFFIEIIKKAFILLSVILCFKYGMYIMLSGYVIANFLAFMVTVVRIKSELKYYFRHQLFDMYKSALVAVVIAITAYALSFVIQQVQVLLFMQIIVCVLLYLLAMRIIYKEFWIEIIGFLSKKLPFLKGLKNI